MSRALALVMLGSLSIAGGAQEAPRKSWQLSDEERLARRFDPANRELRVRASANWRGGAKRDVVEGQRDPDLFLPWELWGWLVETSFGQERQLQEDFQAARLERARDLDLGPDFWDRLEEVSSSYVRSLAELKALALEARGLQGDDRASDDRRVEQLEIAACRARVESLDFARRTFGRETLDRFLYEAVAPGIGIFSVGAETSAEHLRFVARGCR